MIELKEDTSPLPPEIIEPGARPAPERDGAALWRRLSARECLEYATELAADMETGYYTPLGETAPWPEGSRFVITEILRRMGYAPSFIANSRRPAWWPEGGTTAFKGYVEWKIRERAMVGRITYDKLVPYIEALTYMGFAEMARRIKLEPDKVGFRDLSQFTMRGIEVIKAQGDPLRGDQMTPGGADAYERMNKAMEGIGDVTARKAVGAMFDAILAHARERTREVMAIPAKTE